MSFRIPVIPDLKDVDLNKLHEAVLEYDLSDELTNKLGYPIPLISMTYVAMDNDKPVNIVVDCSGARVNP